MSTHWKRLPERGTPFAVKLIGWIALRIGRPVARALLYPIVMYFMFTAAGPRRGARAFFVASGSNCRDVVIAFNLSSMLTGSTVGCA